MKKTTEEWLAKAAEDLLAAELLLSQWELTNIVAFHAQQTVEKAFKAAIEELELGLIRTHSLTRLYQLIESEFPVVDDPDMLDRLDAVYIEARYPSELGLIPSGKPTSEEAAAFHAFATRVLQQIQTALTQR